MNMNDRAETRECSNCGFEWYGCREWCAACEHDKPDRGRWDNRHPWASTLLEGTHPFGAFVVIVGCLLLLALTDAVRAVRKGLAAGYALARKLLADNEASEQ